VEILTTIATNGHWKEAARIPPPLGSLCFTTWNFWNAKKTEIPKIGSLKRKHENQPWEFGLPDL
jgi:hypothetical protein